MLAGKDYLREIQKFTTSQYWNTGVRITLGVMVPTLIMAYEGWIANGMPFLWGALFVSVTDAPGPIHHRRNGMLAAILFNSLSVFITGWCREYQALLLIELMVFSFFFSLLGVFGTRAGAIGTLALVIALLNLVPRQEHPTIFRDTALIAAGGTWYMVFSLLLYRIRPYRLVEQAIGENLIAIADYVRARAAFYKEGANIEESFNEVMQQQIAVHNIQDQTRELLFKTRQFVADANPKSRSMMMIFLDSVDLFEQTTLSYQDYNKLHEDLDGIDVLNKFYDVIIKLAEELEYVGFCVQARYTIHYDTEFSVRLQQLDDTIEQYRRDDKSEKMESSLRALERTLSNIRNISGRVQRLVHYTKLEIDLEKSSAAVQQADKATTGQPIEWQLLRENLTLSSNNFRYSLRLTIAILIGYSVSIFFSLHRTYWVLLTIVTILKPVYAVTRKRNVHRVSGTILGALVGMGILYLLHSKGILLGIMMLSMLMAYSLLRIHYFSFVLFLTVYIIITFHFLSPIESNGLIRDRLVDTFIGAILAALASRFILPVWGHEQIENSMLNMLAANKQFFSATWKGLLQKTPGTEEYKQARKQAFVALANLSDTFQRMLDEPRQTKQYTHIHQFVIANHMLTGHINALATENISEEMFREPALGSTVKVIEDELAKAELNLQKKPVADEVSTSQTVLSPSPPTHQLSIILTLVRDIKLITAKV